MSFYCVKVLPSLGFHLDDLALLLTAIIDSAGKLDNVYILLHLPAWLRLQWLWMLWLYLTHKGMVQQYQLDPAGQWMQSGVPGSSIFCFATDALWLFACIVQAQLIRWPWLSLLFVLFLMAYIGASYIGYVITFMGYNSRCCSSTHSAQGCPFSGYMIKGLPD